MNIEQAKEVLENHTQYFVPTEDIHALNIAIKSLEMWDKVIKELDKQYDKVCFFYYQQGIEFALELIEKYRKEIEE